MLVSYKWLKELVDIDVPSQELAEKMSTTGIEVEGVESPAAGLSKIVVGEVLSCEDVPETHLHVCQVNVGEEEARQIVCGAPNVRAGIKVMVALPGARIAAGEQDKLYLGNLSALRDWGYARDYVECMWLMLQHDTPEDFVIATGEQHSVREFTERAFHEVGIDLRWEGEGVEERGIDIATGRILVEVDPKYFRPAEVETLLGDPTKAKELLGWNPSKTSFEELVRIMVRHDVAYVQSHKHA